MEHRTYNGVKFRILNVIDEYTRECLAIKVDRRLNSHDVMELLTDLFIERDVPVHIVPWAIAPQFQQLSWSNLVKSSR